MPDHGRPHDVRGLTTNALERTKRELRASLALVRPDSPARMPILAHLSAVVTELAERAPGDAGQRSLTPGQLARIGQLSDQWSFLWDKRRSLWIAAEGCPDGEQIEEGDLDVLLARLADGRRLSAGCANPRRLEDSKSRLPSLPGAPPQWSPPTSGGSTRTSSRLPDLTRVP
jgi:hypothetical protein